MFWQKIEAGFEFSTKNYSENDISHPKCTQVTFVDHYYVA